MKFDRKIMAITFGIGVASLGHSHPEIVAAICDQAKTLQHASNLYFMPPQTELAESLVSHSSLDRVFFCNSGAEANEAAIKLVRKYARETYGEERYEIITLEDSFHGRTIATISATAQPKVKKGFAPLLEGFSHVPAGDFAAMEQAVTEKTCAIMLEPILGEGGVVVLPDDYLKKVRQLCTDRDILLIADEIQVGMGRTGRLFAHQWAGIEPDIMTLAKALGGGLPLGAMLAKAKYAETLGAGRHGPTFGGNPVAAAAATATLDLLEEGLMQNAYEVGAFLREELAKLQADFPRLGDVRGRGLMIGLDFVKDPGTREEDPELRDRVAEAAFAKGLLTLPAGPSTLRLSPPLVLSRAEAALAVELLGEVLRELA